MKFSYSRVSCFKNCPYQYKLRYLDELKTIPNTDANNALYLGTAVHTGLEKTVDEALDQYYSNYPVIDDLQINESIKLEFIIPKGKCLIPEGLFEVKIEDNEFVGFIDLLVPKGKNHFDIYDFKYSNNVENYLKSGQLHLYKYYYEKTNPGHTVDNLYFVFLPKIQIRQKKTEDLHQFRQRLCEELNKSEVRIVKVDYDHKKVLEHLVDVEMIKAATEFPKNETRLCAWCEFESYCKRKDNTMIILPENKRVEINNSVRKKIWIYGKPFAGKSTLADKFPDPLFLNTDGNVNNITGQRIVIKREAEMDGRIRKETLPWETFKEIIDTLEVNRGGFKTLVVDLLEDTREWCREYMYQKMKVEHESEAGFGKGYDMIATEYLGTMKRLMALDFENIVLISHEDSSKDITKRNGDKLTSIRPNLNEKLANKIAGMVDIVGRVIAYSDTDRRLSFKADDVVFGGGRLNVRGQEIPLNYDELMKVYDDANKSTTAQPTTQPSVQAQPTERRRVEVNR